jgi:hypothetical protein
MRGRMRALSWALQFKHPYDLATGYYSVHTNADALCQGESNIAAIGRRLHNQGVFSARR